MTTAFVFPGQGSQSVGMGKELAETFPAAKEVFDAVDEALEQRLSAIMFEGPEAELTLTENAQPAIMAVSLAIMAVLNDQGGVSLVNKASHAAGHSVGEFSAYTAAETFSLTDTARLLKVRGKAMQNAVPIGAGAMAVLIGVEPDVAEIIVAEAALDEVCDFANDNSSGQVVISGARSAVERAVEISKTRGAKRTILLPVSAPFHCELMAPAADVMVDALASAEINIPNVTVISNVTAEPVSSIKEIRRLLAEQVTGRVRWRESMETMISAGVNHFVEIGHGKVLSGMTRRLGHGIASSNLSFPKDIETFLAD